MDVISYTEDFDILDCTLSHTSGDLASLATCYSHNDHSLQKQKSHTLVELRLHFFKAQSLPFMLNQGIETLQDT